MIRGIDFVVRVEVGSRVMVGYGQGLGQGEGWLGLGSGSGLGLLSLLHYLFHIWPAFDPAE